MSERQLSLLVTSHHVSSSILHQSNIHMPVLICGCNYLRFCFCLPVSSQPSNAMVTFAAVTSIREHFSARSVQHPMFSHLLCPIVAPSSWLLHSHKVHDHRTDCPSTFSFCCLITRSVCYEYIFWWFGVILEVFWQVQLSHFTFELISVWSLMTWSALFKPTWLSRFESPTLSCWFPSQQTSCILSHKSTHHSGSFVGWNKANECWLWHVVEIFWGSFFWFLKRQAESNLFFVLNIQQASPLQAIHAHTDVFVLEVI